MSGIIRESSPNASVDRRRKVSAMVPICTLRSMTPDLCFCLLADPGSVFYSGGATFGRSMAGAVNACGHAHTVFIFAPLGLSLWPPRTENPRGVGPLGLNFSKELVGYCILGLGVQTPHGLKKYLPNKYHEGVISSITETAASPGSP